MLSKIVSINDERLTESRNKFVLLYDIMQVGGIPAMSSAMSASSTKGAIEIFHLSIFCDMFGFVPFCSLQFMLQYILYEFLIHASIQRVSSG